jgi:ParB-like chromosome segregation protein Spo0J
MENFQLLNLLTGAINTSTPWSLHQDLSREPDPDFVSSVKQFGIIRPPLVQILANGEYQLVCGAMRLWAVTEMLGRTRIDCLVLDHSFSAPDLLALIIEDQKLSGSLSPIEKARAGLLCKQMLGSDGDKLIVSSGLGSTGMINRLIKLLDLEKPIRNTIHAGRISEQTGRELQALTAGDRLLLHRLFQKLQLNHNKQKRIIDLGRIVTTQNRSTFKEFFSTQYPELLDDTVIDNLPQTTNHLLQDLTRRSSPLLNESAELFDNQVARLDLPHFCSLAHSKSFEQDKINLNIEFENLDAFIRKWSKIKNYFK